MPTEEALKTAPAGAGKPPRLALGLEPAERIPGAAHWVHFPWTHPVGAGAQEVLRVFDDARSGGAGPNRLGILRVGNGLTAAGFVTSATYGGPPSVEETALSTTVPVPQFYGMRGVPAAEVEVFAWRERDGVAVVQVPSAHRGAIELLELASVHGLHELVLWAHAPDAEDGGVTFDSLRTLLDTIYVSGRVQLGVKGVTLIGW